jgi:hypothetical protein
LYLMNRHRSHCLHQQAMNKCCTFVLHTSSVHRAQHARVMLRRVAVLLRCRRESSAGGYLEFIQEQEEEALQAALKKLQEQQAAVGS